jgi:hypothetical protein
MMYRSLARTIAPRAVHIRSCSLRKQNQTMTHLIQRYQVMSLAPALDREDAQQVIGYVDPDPLLLRIQQIGDPPRMLNAEMK